MKTASITVPYFDLKAQYGLLRDEIREALDRLCETPASKERIAAMTRSISITAALALCLALAVGMPARAGVYLEVGDAGDINAP